MTWRKACWSVLVVAAAFGAAECTGVGQNCNTDADCPSGFTCGGVIESCNPNGTAPVCPTLNDGSAAQCLAFSTVNEPVSYYCSGPDGQPYVYFSACNPLSGFCPASDFP